MTTVAVLVVVVMVLYLLVNGSGPVAEKRDAAMYARLFTPEDLERIGRDAAGHRREGGDNDPPEGRSTP